MTMAKQPTNPNGKISHTHKKPANQTAKATKVTKLLKRNSPSTSPTGEKQTGTKQTQTSSQNKTNTKISWLNKVKREPTNDARLTKRKKNKHADDKRGRLARWFIYESSGASTLGNHQTDKFRFYFMWGVSALLFAILISKAFYLQVINPKFYQDKGNQLIHSVSTQTVYRGMIVDRNGYPLAISAPLSTVYFSPHDYARDFYELKKQWIDSKPGETKNNLAKKMQQMDLNNLATTAKVDVNALKKSVNLRDDIDVHDDDAVKSALPSGAGSHYFLLFNKVTPEIAKSVTDLKFYGVYEDRLTRRYYPQSQPNAQLIGFMAESASDPKSGYRGRAGIERQYDDVLAGKAGKVLVVKDGKRNTLQEVAQIEPEVAGQDVTLTIDSRLQYLLYKELEAVGKYQQAMWATGIVVDIKTGEILGLSSWPSFNANNLSEMTGESQRNRALLDSFEPGSVMKPFTVAAALASDKYHKDSLIDTSPGFIRIKGHTINDHGNLGTISFATLLQKSSTVASTKIALSLPSDAISNMQHKFGFGQKTALNFPGEQKGTVVIPKDNETARRATVSYGYGLEVTLAQLAQAYATLGNGGIKVPLSLIKSDPSQDTSNTTPYQPKQDKPKMAPSPTQVISRADANAIVDMMEAVTLPGGTATSAAIDGYRVAGKSGTSRRVNPKGGYFSDQHRTVFAGVAPVSNPRLVVVISVENPQKQHYAGKVAAPVFHNVMQEALRLYDVPYDKPLKSTTTSS